MGVRSVKPPLIKSTQPGTSPSTLGDSKFVTVDQFNSRYYSGLEVALFFDNVFIDEVVELQYEIQERAYPLYSYADYTYRKMIHGTRSINGSFTINFKRSHYIIDVMQMLSGAKFQKSAIVVDNDLINANLMNPMTMEDILGTVTGSNGQIDFTVLDKLSQMLNNTYYGSGSEFKSSADAANGPLFGYPLEGFDLYIRYGTPNVYGYPAQPTQDAAAGTEYIGTFEKITGVTILSCGKRIDDSGRPVLESYSFIGKDFDITTY